MKLSKLLLACAGILMCACSPETDPVLLPTAKFSYVVNGLTVSFKSESTNAYIYEWRFGDGTTADDPEPVHTYAKAGNYTVVLKASTQTHSSTISHVVTVTEDKIDNNYCIVNVVNQTGYSPTIDIAGHTLAYAKPNETFQMELYERWITLSQLYENMGDIETEVMGKSVLVEVGFVELWQGYPDAIPAASRYYAFQKGRQYDLIIVSTTEIKIELKI